MLRYVWIALATVWIFQVAFIVYRRQQAGRVLLDLGPAPRRYLMLACATMLGGLGVVQAFTGVPWQQPVAYGTWAIYMVVAGMGRFQLQEKGISTGVDVVPWAMVRAFDANGLRFKRLFGESNLKVTLQPGQVERAKAIVNEKLQ